MKTNLKIKASSDFHGNLPSNDEVGEFDLFLICGDICPAYNHSYTFQVDWFEHTFCKWVNNLPFNDENSKVIMTWGNHDFIGERIKDDELNKILDKTNGRLIILKNEECEFNGLRIFGTPYCKQFYNWAFMLPNDKLSNKYDKISEGIDVLISHDSPMIEEYGMIREGWQKGTDVGNPVLAGIIRDRKPKMAFFGHIHSHDHSFRKVGDTWMAGVSYINEDYKPAFSVLSFEYNNGEIIK